ncbi:MAG TPA: hypothetical protein VII63_00295 [Caulobacteraceae bacterium]
MRAVLSLLPVLLAGAAIAAISPSRASAEDLSGTWSVSGTIISNGRMVGSATPVCTFQQAGSRLAGTCQGPNGMGPVLGTTNGSNVFWRWHNTATTARGITTTITFRGTIGPDEVIRGAMTFGSMPWLVGSFTQQRQ